MAAREAEGGDLNPSSPSLMYRQGSSTKIKDE